MNRKTLRAIGKQVSAELEKRSYEEFKALTFPHSYREEREGVEVNVELVLLEDSPDHLHISVVVDDGGWFRSMFPVGGNSFFVAKGIRCDNH
jgi:hypothetical protein